MSLGPDKKDIDVDVLVGQVCQPRGCKVSHIEDPKAVEFISKVVAEKLAGRKPIIERVSEILMEYWEIDIPRRALSAHINGKCKTCRTKKL